MKQPSWWKLGGLKESKMTDLEYLKKVKEMDRVRFSSEGRMLDKCLESIEFRKIKALEIIAEELIKISGTLNKN